MRKLADDSKKSSLLGKPSKLLTGESRLLGESRGPVKRDKDDPYRDVDYTGNPEVDSKAELSAGLNYFQERDKAQKGESDARTDTTFYACIIFETTEQRDEFLKKANVWRDDDEDHRFIDGVSFAERLGIKLNPTPFKAFNPNKEKNRWVRFATKGRLH